MLLLLLMMMIMIVTMIVMNMVISFILYSFTVRISEIPASKNKS